MLPAELSQLYLMRQTNSGRTQYVCHMLASAALYCMCLRSLSGFKALSAAQPTLSVAVLHQAVRIEHMTAKELTSLI